MYAVDGTGSAVAATAEKRQEWERLEAEQMQYMLCLWERRDLSNIDSEAGERTNGNTVNE